MEDTASPSSEWIEGVVERIIYQNEESGYGVVLLMPEDRSGAATITGPLAALRQGEQLRCEGSWVMHPRFGRQFVATGFETRHPGTREGIIKYLSGGEIHGIGPKLAEMIVDTLGTDVLKIIDETPDRLLEVSGIGRKRLEEIRRSWDVQRGLREVLVFFQGHGLGPAHAARVYREYGSAAIRMVKENPYRLSEEIFGIGFKTADKIAINLGVEEDAPFRIRATLSHLLDRATHEGHLCLPYPELVEQAGLYLNIAPETVEEQLSQLSADGRLVIESRQNPIETEGDLIGDKPMVFMRSLRDAETSVAFFLMRLKAHAKWTVPIDIPRAIAWAEQEAHLSLDETQRDAVAAALKEPVLVITGGPGVGKTTIIRCISRILSMKDFRLSLTAPTGRAAKRLGEATGFKASTIHRLLGFNPHNMTFEHDEDNPLPCDVLIADESSMIDVPLMERLLRAMKPAARLILVGDVDQLPSVGPGELLHALIACERFKVIRLTKLFRQEEGGDIPMAAHSVNQGGFPRFTNTEDVGEVYFLDKPNGEEAAEQVIKLVRDRIPDRFGLDPSRDLQVLTPMHKGSCGTENLNQRLQEALNPEGESLTRYGRIYRAGDKVMQIRNNYNLNVFNGDIGYIEYIDKENNCLKVRIDNQLIEYDFEILDELVHAYCISIHKSQGSEFPAVVIPLLTQHYILLRRNLLYTGITRARKLLIIVGSERALNIAISNAQTRLRYSLLEDRLRS